MRKKAIAILCLYLLGFTLPLVHGCARSSPKIAFFLYDGDDTYINELMEHMTAGVPEGASFEVRNAGNSQVVQNQQIVELINGGFDLFIINAVDRLACSSIVEKCSQKGIPVIFFNREPLNDALTGGNVFYVGAMADNLGKKQAEIVAELFGDDFASSKYDRNKDGSIQLVILKGEQGHQDAEKRTDNCVNYLKELEFTVDVLAIEVADWDRQHAYEAMKLLFAQYGSEIELVFSNNDDMALGAIDYLLDARVFSMGANGYDQPFVIVGVDGTSVGLEAIENGLMYATVRNDSMKQSDAIMSLAEYIMHDMSFDDFPYDIVNGRYVYIDGYNITSDTKVDS